MAVKEASSVSVPVACCAAPISSTVLPPTESGECYPSLFTAAGCFPLSQFYYNH